MTNRDRTRKGQISDQNHTNSIINEMRGMTGLKNRKLVNGGPAEITKKQILGQKTSKKGDIMIIKEV